MAQNNSINKKLTELTIDPGASGDSVVQFSINGTGEWRLGVDDDASDSFKLSQGSALGTNDSLVISSDGNTNRPLNPAFLGYIASQDADVTGDNTQYVIGTNVAYTEIFDAGSDFNTNGTFTAPVTGRYLLVGQVRILCPAAGGNSFTVSIATSNRTYFGQNYPTRGNVANFYGNSETLSGYINCIADMDIADTAVLRLGVFGGAKTSDINVGSSTTVYTYFCGYLIT